jgi:hypothetical protein
LASLTGAFVGGQRHQDPAEVHGTDTARLLRIRKILDRNRGRRVCWNSNQDDYDGGFDANFSSATRSVRSTCATCFSRSTRGAG